MRCLLLGVVMMEIVDFDLGVSLRNVSDQDMEKAIIKVPRLKRSTFDLSWQC